MKITPNVRIACSSGPSMIPSETKGGLLIPDIAAQNRMFIFAEVMGVGPGRVNTEGKMVKMHVQGRRPSHASAQGGLSGSDALR